MASGDLFRPFSLRFSLKNEQHVKILQRFNDKKLNGGRVKNQIVMDALEMYLNELENKKGVNFGGKKILTVYFTRVGNTNFGDDVDAVSGASLLRSEKGN